MSVPDAASQPTPRRRAGLWWLAVALVALVGFALRAGNLDWDRGQHLHPDERYWSFVLDDISAPSSLADYFSPTSPLNPHTHDRPFVYGTLPLYATKAAASVLTTDAAHPLVRALDAVGIDLLHPDGTPRFDAGYRANLVGRLLAALADTTTIVLVGVLGRLLAGRAAGIAAAAAYAVAVLPLQLAHFLGPDPFVTAAVTATAVASVVHRRRGGWGWIAVAGLTAGVAVSCRLPGALALALPLVAVVSRWWSSSAEQRRRAVVPALASLAGALVLAALVFRVTNPFAFDGLVHLSPRWVADLAELRRIQDGADVPPNLQWVGRVPLVYPLQQLVLWGIGPACALAAALGAVALWRARARGHAVLLVWVGLWVAFVATTWVPTMRYLAPAYPALAVWAGAGLVALVRSAAPAPRTRAVAAASLAVLTVAWGFAFAHGVYGHTNSRVAASLWMARNVPASAVVSIDEWDDGLPLRLGPAIPQYQTVAMQPFVPDSAAKVERMIDQLSQVDVVVVSSQRARGSVARLPARFPAMLRYYDALRDGSLGFERIASFHNVPRLGPFTVDTSGAEEAFSVYDHPPVELYRRTDRFSRETARLVLDPASADLAVSPALRTAGNNALLARPGRVGLDREGGSLDHLLGARGPVALGLWMLWWVVLAAAALPACALLLPRLRAGPAALALVAGPGAVVVLVWTVGSWTSLPLAGATVAGCSAAVVAAGVAVARRHWPAFAARARRDGRVWVAVAAAAAMGFAAAMVLRTANPDLWSVPRGGEKPMELAYLTSLARARTLPPLDPWFAGGAMNYYYLGWFALTVPGRLVGLAPEVVFQLGLALVVAVSAALAVALAHDAVSLLRPAASRVARAVAAAVSLFALLVAGNLDAARQVVGWVGAAGPPLDWWATSRRHHGRLDITEFPSWSVLFGDLHPHLMGMVTNLTVLVLALGLVALPRAESAANRARGLVLVAGLGTALGVVRAVNTWDLPMLGVLAAVAVGVAVWRTRTSTRQRAAALAGHLLVLVAVEELLTWPYRRDGALSVTGVRAAVAHTGLVDQLLHLGPLWLVTGAAVVTGLVLGGPGRRRLVALVAVGACAAVGLAVGGPVLAVSVALVVGLPLAVPGLARGGRSDRLAVAAVVAVLVAGVAVTAVPEVVTVVPDIDRMNTVFKLTFQGWQLLAVAAGPTVVLVWWAQRRRAARASLVVGAAALVVATAAFPLLAPWPRLDDRFAVIPPTLDGLAYLDTGPVVDQGGAKLSLEEDLPLVRWLRANAPGGSTVLEMTGEGYTWNGRVAVLTGLPTILGWPWHQTQQRPGAGDVIRRRQDDVLSAYTSGREATVARILRAYRVRYVVVGTEERARSTPEALAALRRVPGVSVAYEAGPAAVLEVDQRALARALATAPLSP